MKTKSFTRRTFLRSSSAVTASTMLIAAGIAVVPVASSAGEPGQPRSKRYTNNGSTTKKKNSVTAILSEKTASGQFKEIDRKKNSEDIPPAKRINGVDYPAGSFDFEWGPGTKEWKIEIED